MVTCGTYLKRPWFSGAERLRLLYDALLRLTSEYGWNLQASAFFANHYHFVALTAGEAQSLQSIIKTTPF
jgi:hypothetical protein